MVLIKNNLSKNYFNPRSLEAKKIYDEIFSKVVARYPLIEEEVIFEIDKDLKYSTAELEDGFYRLFISGRVVFRKKRNKLYIYPSVCSVTTRSIIFLWLHMIFFILYIMCIIRKNFFLLHTKQESGLQTGRQ